MIIDFLNNAIPAIFFLVKVSCVAILAGIGPFILIAPSSIKRSPLGIPLLLGFGLGMVSLTSLYILSVNAEAKWSVHAAIGISIASLTIAAAFKLPWLLDELRSDFTAVRKWIFALALNSMAVLFLISPGFCRGMAQPFRIGVDQLGYAMTGQYLLDGGSLQALTSEVVRQTGIADADRAIQANASCLEMNINIASEFLLKSKRWYPAMLAAMCSTTGNGLVESCQLPLLFFPLLLLLHCAWHMFIKFFSFPTWIALLAAWAATYNCNILNVLCEGQHAQIYAMPFLALLIFQLIEFRSGAYRDLMNGHIEVRQLLFTAIIMAFLMGGYSELAMVIVAITAIAAMIDLMRWQLNRIRSLMLFTLCVLLGMALTGPYGLSWPEFIFAHVKNLQSNGGFWQPQWGLPPEIVGIFDMYNPAASIYIGRGFNQEIMYEIISIGMMEIAFLFLFINRKRVDVSVWIAPIAFVTLIFIKVYWVNHIHNYQYMKAYTMLGLFFTGLFLASLAHLFQNPQSNRTLASWWAPVLASALIITTGLQYISHFENESKILPRELAIDNQLRKTLDAEQTVILCAKGNVEQMMLGAYLRFNWLNLGWGNPFLLPHSGKRIILLVLKSDLIQPEATTMTPYSILYETSSLAILDTGKTINALDYSDSFIPTANPGKIDPTLIAKLNHIIANARLNLKP